MDAEDLAAIPLIQESEGNELKAYPDTNGIPTIGRGSIYITRNGKLRRVVMEDTCTQQESDDMFMEGYLERKQQLNGLIKSACSLTKRAALLDFLYQFGAGNLGSSQLLKRVNAEPNDDISPAFIQTLKSYIGRAATVTIHTEAAFLSDWAKEMVNCPADSIAYQFLRWVHGNHGEVVFGILKRQMKNIVLYNS